MISYSLGRVHSSLLALVPSTIILQMQKEPDHAPKTGWLRRAGKSVANSWRTSHIKAWHDLRMRWARGLLLAFYLCIALAAVYFLSLLIRVSITASYFGFVDLSTACLPDGRFSLHPLSFQFWTAPEVFEITVGFGNLSFTRAKVIDVIWDVVSNISRSLFFSVRD